MRVNMRRRCGVQVQSVAEYERKERQYYIFQYFLSFDIFYDWHYFLQLFLSSTFLRHLFRSSRSTFGSKHHFWLQFSSIGEESTILFCYLSWKNAAQFLTFYNVKIRQRAQRKLVVSSSEFCSKKKHQRKDCQLLTRQTNMM